MNNTSYWCHWHGQYTPHMFSHQNGLSTCPQCAQENQMQGQGYQGVQGGGLSQMAEDYRHKEIVSLLNTIIELLRKGKG